MDDELGRAGDTEEGLLRSCAETQGCTAPGRSTDVGRGDSLLVAVLLELLVLPLENTEVRRLKHQINAVEIYCSFKCFFLNYY